MMKSITPSLQKRILLPYLAQKCLRHQSHIMREIIAQLSQPIQAEFSPSHIVTHNGDFMVSSMQDL